MNDVRMKILDLNSIPFASALIGGKGACVCDPDKHVHMDFLEFNKEPRGSFPDGVEICFSHYNIEDKYLPRLLTGTGKRYGFKDITTAKVLNDILYRGTHWYRNLWNGNKPSATVKQILAIATGLIKEPNFGVLLNSETTKRGLTYLRNAITNSDGVLQTLFLTWAGKAGPWEEWAYVDNVVKFLMVSFVRDAYRDGTVGYEPFYTIVKEVRASIKDLIPKERLINRTHVRGLFFYVDLLDHLNEPVETRRQAQDLAILTQKRSIGMPPPSYREAAYNKYYLACTRIVDPLSDEVKSLLKESARQSVDTVTDREDFLTVISRCQRNEKVSLSGSADLISKKSVGGKLKSANELLCSLLPVEVLNLEDGSSTGDVITLDQVRDGSRSIGEGLFYIAFKAFKEDFYGEKKDISLFCVKPVAVSDNNKYRVATASHPLHAFFLQPFAQVSKPFMKTFESSKAGMDKQYHAWEFYKRIKPKMVTDIKTKEKLIQVENFFKCEDWTMATDLENREASHIVLGELAVGLGLPKLYAKLAIRALLSPRINILNPNEKVPPYVCPGQFVSTSGILQGDPITKTLLHFTHIVSRFAGQMVLNKLAEVSTMLNPDSIKRGWPGSDRSAKYSVPDRAVFGNQNPKLVRHGQMRQTPVNTTGSVPFRFPQITKFSNPREDEELFRTDLKEYLKTYFGKKGERGTMIPFLREMGFVNSLMSRAKPEQKVQAGTPDMEQPD